MWKHLVAHRFVNKTSVYQLGNMYRMSSSRKGQANAYIAAISLFHRFFPQDVLLRRGGRVEEGNKLECVKGGDSCTTSCSQSTDSRFLASMFPLCFNTIEHKQLLRTRFTVARLRI